MDPGAIVGVTLAASLLDAASDGRLVADLPSGWTVVDGEGAAVDPNARTLVWSLGSLGAGADARVAASLRAPALSPAGDAVFDTTITARVEHAGGTAANAATTVLVAPALVVEHSVLALLAPVTHEASYLAPETDLDGLARFDRFRVRFQVRNADLVPVDVAPGLQFAPGGTDQFVDVPVNDAEDGVPIYVDTEWRLSPSGRGTRPAAAQEPIAPGALQVRDTDSPSQEPVTGRRFMGDGPRDSVSVPADSYTEIEFSLRVSRDIAPDETIQLRLTDAGRAIVGAATATVGAAQRVTLPLSPGQRNGIRVGPPVDVKPAAVSEVDFPLVTPAAVEAGWRGATDAPRYRLAIAGPPTTGTESALFAAFTSPHVPDTSLVSDTCAACHRAHAAQDASLAAAAPQATACFACHNGTGSNLDTMAQFADSAVPANDPATTSYYRHDAATTPAAPNTHSLAKDDEFGGVSNRHSVCADCHNAHNATATTPVQYSDGWSVSGRQSAISGVAVAAAGGGAPPTYTFLDGSAGSTPGREYQVCIKCHSGFTELRPPDPGHPSRDAVDKGIELSASDASYHPIAAAGTNATTQMAWSLSNTSPYKQWNFTTQGTVRCVHCHGDPRKISATAPPQPDADLAAHTSQFRGLLIQNYRDRELKAPDEVYDAADFALCFTCHAEQPFRSGSQAITRFDDHDLHMSTIAGEGPGGTDIDTPGAGGGNAICAECHFRTHSTAQAYNEADRANMGLVNFAPNVEPYNGVLQFTRTATGGSCTLVCHGEIHDSKTYP